MISRRAFTLAASGGALIGSLPACAGTRRRAGEAAPVAGPADGAQDDTWLDAARNRPIPLRLRFPAGPGPWPVILFSHGLGGNRAGAAQWGRAWAEAGFMVVHLQHPGSDTEAMRADRGAAFTPQQHAARRADVRFVLDELARRKKLPGTPYFDADLGAIGLAGHSFGARTTLGLAGSAPGTELSAFEPRIKAFIAFSPSDSLDQAAYRALRGPLLFVTGTLDGDVAGLGATPQSRLQAYEQAQPGSKYLLVLDGADHFTFAGQTDLPRLLTRQRPPLALAREAQHHSLVQALTSTYWRAMLNGQAQARAMLTSGAGVAAPDVWRAK